MSVSKQLILGSFAGGLILALLIVLIRWEQGKEFFMPAFLSGLIIFAILLSFSLAGVRATFKTVWYWWFFVVVISVFSGFFISRVEKAWPAENMTGAEEDYIAVMEQAENWPVIETDDQGLEPLLGKVHKIPDTTNILRGYAVTIWFPNKDNNYEWEVFMKVVNIGRSYDTRFYNFRSAILVLKQENNVWTPPVSYSRLLIRDGQVRLFDGREGPGIAFSVLDPSDQTRFYRAFLLEDLMRPKK